MASTKLAWKPWHQVVRLRDDLRTGELALASFAADLHAVMMGEARPVYQEPREFFALTYPTYALRELVKDVVLRLAAKSEKAIRQLELTYGGGKTHTLITLFHLVSNPAHLPDLPAVHEFTGHIGVAIPQARVAVLSFDKLDVEKGMEVQAPDGSRRWLKHPWSVLAFQLAGAEGLRLLHAENQETERESAPAENLLAPLLARPGQDGLSTLILMDEVLMYAREKIGLDPAWQGRLVNFFQYLTQAVVKVDHCALVVSLLATDPAKSDELGKAITRVLQNVLTREREAGVQPVGKDDVAEVLRRRLFTPDSIRDREAFRPHVVAALKGIAELDEQTRKEGKQAEERLLRSFPFHPDLTDVFYTKWVNLEGFQSTRGVLRTFALALRDAEAWDEGPLVDVNVFLGAPAGAGLGEAARELAGIAAAEEIEGRRHEWRVILEGELQKARVIQDDFAGLKFREVEQAVLATFLHSQPIGHKALTRDLLVLIGDTRPDKIELEKALRRWAETSWFLDEEALAEVSDAAAATSLPKTWRLGSKPNLRQMHYDACLRVSPDLIETRLLDEIGKLKKLTSGASAAGARVHNLPERPRDVDDDGEFHYAVLGPKAASESGKPSAEARRFLEETTAADRPRVHRNAVVLAVPSHDGLEIARNRLREHLGWLEVQNSLKDKDVDPLRQEMLAANLEAARRKVPEAVQQAYSIVVTVSEKNEVQAFKLSVGEDPLFTQIKVDPRSRIQDTAVSAEALLPEGPYDLWHAGETARRVRDLVGAFAQNWKLPKMLNRQAILDTVMNGCRDGLFILRVIRPDRSTRTFWRQIPSETELKDPNLEVVLPEAASLSELEPTLLCPGVLPGLWAGDEIAAKHIFEYFAGGKVVKVKRENYEEPFTIPKAERAVLEEAIQEAVKGGRLWLTAGPASIFAEAIPVGILSEGARLQAPPTPIPTTDLLPTKLSDAWAGETTTALALATALSQREGKTLPWVTVRDAIDGALRARLLELTVGSGQWPCEFNSAQLVTVRLPTKKGTGPLPPDIRSALRVEAELTTGQLQDLADQIGELNRIAAGHDLRLILRIELGGKSKVPEELVSKLNAKLEEISGDLKLESIR